MPNNYTKRYVHQGEYPIAQRINEDGSFVPQRNNVGQVRYIDRWREVLVDNSKDYRGN